MAEFDLTNALSPDYLVGLDRLSLSGLRAKRDACAELETELSYLRRLAQARIDLIWPNPSGATWAWPTPAPKTWSSCCPDTF